MLIYANNNKTKEHITLCDQGARLLSIQEPFHGMGLYFFARVKTIFKHIIKYQLFSHINLYDLIYMI